MGGQDFVEHVWRTYLDQASGESRREQPQLKVVRNYWKPEDLVKSFCQIIGKDEDEICRRGKNSTDRAILMEVLYRFCNITQPEIGKLVGGIDYRAVSVARKRLRFKMESDVSLASLFKDIINQLSRLKISFFKLGHWEDKRLPLAGCHGPCLDEHPVPRYSFPITGVAAFGEGGCFLCIYFYIVLSCCPNCVRVVGGMGKKNDTTLIFYLNIISIK